MQTERVTFLTTPDHKAALDAFARAKGMSVGHVVREATSRYLLEREMTDEEQAALLLRELDGAVPRMRADIEGAMPSARRRIEE
ncbi:hypothetical protein KZ813_08260 [Sphingomonas sp. RHCKR7]|uniref:hypothetical protein n=1 Tax=Sphingomonas folli TaxID=2862497 RepID=UPI001CA4D124|nr:hypothetical protein [Sphingomonas folli]MBW6526827.1 hypothetical protein [Sphingomonas folli]